jgi:hypothetical protein
MVITCRHCQTATKETSLRLVSWACWRCVLDRCRGVAERTTRLTLSVSSEPIQETIGRMCQQCGRSMASRRAGARFCSPACRVAWNRSGKAAVTDSPHHAPNPPVTLRRRVAPPEAQENPPIEAMETQDG